jgi:hypothetical protein
LFVNSYFCGSDLKHESFVTIQGKLKIAKNLLVMGLDVKAVATAAALPVAKIVELQRTMLS